MKEGPKIKSDIRRFPAHDLARHTKPLGPIINEIKVLFMTDKETPVVAILFFKMSPNISSQDVVMRNIFCEFEISAYNILGSRGPTILLAESQKTRVATMFFIMRPKIFPIKML